jgi:predicted component of type VI protein secretion system
MGDVIYLPGASNRANSPDSDYPALSRDEVRRLECIRDNIEQLLNMVSGIRNDPEAVALAAGRYGLMRMYQLQGRAAVMAFADRCVETAEIAEDLQQS